MSQSQFPNLCMHGLVKGRVQGVFFRAETRREAERLGLSGWVRNTLEGHVEILFSGEQHEIGEMREWLKKGPPRARVDRVELVEISSDQATENHGLSVGKFEIRQ